MCGKSVVCVCVGKGREGEGEGKKVVVVGRCVCPRGIAQEEKEGEQEVGRGRKAKGNGIGGVCVENGSVKITGEGHGSRTTPMPTPAHPTGHTGMKARCVCVLAGWGNGDGNW